MKKKSLVILGIVLACLIVGGVIAAILATLPHKPVSPQGTSQPGETPSAQLPDFLPRFSCVTMTPGENGAEEMNVTWKTMGDDGAGIVLYLPKNGEKIIASPEELLAASPLSAAAETEEAVLTVPKNGQESYKNPVTEDRAGFVHRVWLTGLTPDTEYYYAVGTEAKADCLSEVRTFRTFGSGTDFSFLLVSDTQGFTQRNFDVWGSVADAAQARFPDSEFVLHLGDTVEDGKNLYQWQTYLDAGKSLTAHYPFVSVVGNQDKKYTLLHYTFGSRDNSTALLSGYYSFERGSIHFSVLNTGDGNKDLQKSQLKWLKKDLEAAKDKVKIILIHKAPYSDANHTLDEEILAIRAQILPVASAYGVACVLEGHDHYYFRSLPVTENGKADFTETVLEEDGDRGPLFHWDGAGTVYFMNGSAGCKQHNDPIIPQREILSDRSELLSGPSFSYVSVTEEQIVFRTYMVSGGACSLLEVWGIRF